MTDNTTTTTDDETSGLKTKNADLLRKLSDEKAAKKALEDRLQALEDERDSAADNGKSEIERLKATHERELKKLTDGNAALNTRLSELLIDNEIKTAITANKVLPQFAPAVTALLKNGAALKDGVAMAGDVPLADHIKAFMTGDEGKHFIAEPANSGGGAKSSFTSSASGWTKPPSTAEEYNRFFELTNTNPSLSNSLAEQWAMPHLKV